MEFRNLTHVFLEQYFLRLIRHSSCRYWSDSNFLAQTKVCVRMHTYKVNLNGTDRWKLTLSYITATWSSSDRQVLDKQPKKVQIWCMKTDSMKVGTTMFWSANTVYRIQFFHDEQAFKGLLLQLWYWKSVLYFYPHKTFYCPIYTYMIPGRKNLWKNINKTVAKIMVHEWCTHQDFIPLNWIHILYQKSVIYHLFPRSM